MSGEKLKSLAKQFPEYSQIFEAVLVWFATHPRQNEVSMELFNSNRYSFSMDRLHAAFIIMDSANAVAKSYKVLDESGVRVGDKYKSIDQIPPVLNTMEGHKKEIKDLFIVPVYSLES